MEKSILRSVLMGLSVGQQVSVLFRGAEAIVPLEVVAVTTGRGKGGSKLAVLRDCDGTEYRMGTPTCSEVLGMQVGDTFLGVRSASEEPPVYPTDLTRAVAYKAMMTSAENCLVGPQGAGRMVRLTSELPEFNGIFVVMSGKLERGKYGQVHLTLQSLSDEPGGSRPVEFWSYRHSGVVVGAEVFPATPMPELRGVGEATPMLHTNPPTVEVPEDCSNDCEDCTCEYEVFGARRSSNS